MSEIDVQGIETASLSDVGRQRSTNQDHYGSMLGASGARLLFLADGMGGHAGGATASHIAVEVVERIFGTSDEAPEVMLRTALESANAEVHARAREDASLTGMGTTGVGVLLLPDGQGWVANVGDSRAYRLRDGVFEQLTDDHSLVAELQRRGMLTPEEALVHPRRNEVLRSLGVEAEVNVDVIAVDIRPGDSFLLCSDGLSGVVGDSEIAAVLAAEPPEIAAERLVAAANERGGPDNVTVQIARIPRVVASDPLAEQDRRQQRRERNSRLRALLGAMLVVIGLLLVVLLWWASEGGQRLDVPDTREPAAEGSAPDIGAGGSAASPASTPRAPARP